MFLISVPRRWPAWPSGQGTRTRDQGGHSSVVSASEFKSKDPGFDPLVGQGEGHFLYPSESTLCAELFVPDMIPLRVYGSHPNLSSC